MSDSALPENADQAGRWVIGTIFAFVSGFEGYVMLWDGRIIHGTISIAICFLLVWIMVKWNSLFGFVRRMGFSHGMFVGFLLATCVGGAAALYSGWY
jgi:hypothetical protein